MLSLSNLKTNISLTFLFEPKKTFIRTLTSWPIYNMNLKNMISKRRCLTSSNKLNSTSFSLTFKVSLPFITSMRAPAVARKVQPKMIGILVSFSISNIIKSTGMINYFFTLISTFSRISTRHFTDGSASCKEIVVGLTPLIQVLQTHRRAFVKY